MKQTPVIYKSVILNEVSCYDSLSVLRVSPAFSTALGLMREDGFRETALTLQTPAPPQKEKNKEDDLQLNSLFGPEKQHQISVCCCGFGPGYVFKAKE